MKVRVVFKRSSYIIINKFLRPRAIGRLQILGGYTLSRVQIMSMILGGHKY